MHLIVSRSPSDGQSDINRLTETDADQRSPALLALPIDAPGCNARNAEHTSDKEGCMSSPTTGPRGWKVPEHGTCCGAVSGLLCIFASLCSHVAALTVLVMPNNSRKRHGFSALSDKRCNRQSACGCESLLAKRIASVVYILAIPRLARLLHELHSSPHSHAVILAMLPSQWIASVTHRARGNPIKEDRKPRFAT